MFQMGVSSDDVMWTQLPWIQILMRMELELKKLVGVSYLPVEFWPLIDPFYTKLTFF